MSSILDTVDFCKFASNLLKYFWLLFRPQQNCPFVGVDGSQKKVSLMYPIERTYVLLLIYWSCHQTDFRFPPLRLPRLQWALWNCPQLISKSSSVYWKKNYLCTFPFALLLALEHWPNYLHPFLFASKNDFPLLEMVILASVEQMVLMTRKNVSED